MADEPRARPKTPHWSFRMSPEDRELLASLAKQLGVKQAQVIRMALHYLRDGLNRQQPPNNPPA